MFFDHPNFRTTSTDGLITARPRHCRLVNSQSQLWDVARITSHTLTLWSALSSVLQALIREFSGSAVFVVHPQHFRSILQAGKLLAIVRVTLGKQRRQMVRQQKGKAVCCNSPRHDRFDPCGLAKSAH